MAKQVYPHTHKSKLIQIDIAGHSSLTSASEDTESKPTPFVVNTMFQLVEYIYYITVTRDKKDN